MRIVSWNCNKGYYKKKHRILELNPDIAIISECLQKDCSGIWVGDNKTKGLGIFSYNGWKLSLIDSYNPAFKYIVPIKVTKDNLMFNLLAVWAMNDTVDRRQRYIGQVWQAINYYQSLLGEPTIIVGDFNWNMSHDKKPSYPLYGNLAQIIEFLRARQIFSVYHDCLREEFGQESAYTLYMYRHSSPSFHTEYCFASDAFRFDNVLVGKFDEWIIDSDHVPLIASLGIR